MSPHLGSRGLQGGGGLTSGRVRFGGALQRGCWEEGLGQDRALTASRHLLCHPSSSCCPCWAPGRRPPQPAHAFLSPRFMEFEEEDMQIQKLQWMKAEQGLPPPAPPRPDPWEPPAPLVGSQPGRAPSSHGQRQLGLRASHCSHIGPFLQRVIFLSTTTAMGARVSGALCHHRVWTWSSFVTPLPTPCHRMQREVS